MTKLNEQQVSTSNDGLLLREVQHSDFAQWKPLWDGYNAFYGRKDETALREEISNGPGRDS